MIRALALAALLFAAPAFAMGPVTAHITTHKGKQVKLVLEVASTAQSRERGLMMRTTLKPYDGMAFFFPRTAPQDFWMKDTLLALDILFIDEGGRITYIAHGEPHSEARLGDGQPIATVIEIASGRAATLGIAAGDTVRYDIKGSPQSLANESAHHEK